MYRFRKVFFIFSTILISFIAFSCSRNSDVESPTPTIFDVFLVGNNGDKIALIKAVREIANLDLAAGTNLVNAAAIDNPQLVKGNLDKVAADSTSQKLINASGKVEVRGK